MTKLLKRLESREAGFNEYQTYEGKSLAVHPRLAHFLLSHVENAKDNMGDVVGIIVGEEGAGKSKLVRQLSRLVDPTMTEARIEFTPDGARAAHFKGLPEGWNYERYVEGGYSSKPWECIVMDESVELARKNATTSLNKEFVGFITQSRQLHKVFLIVLPDIFLLERYVAESRAKFVIHVEFDRKNNSRIWKYYNRKGMRQIFATPPQFRNQSVFKRIRPVASSTFSNKEPFDLTVYYAKKAAALEKYRVGGSGVVLDSAALELRAAWERAFVENAVKKSLKPDKVLYESLNMPRRTWENLKKAARLRLGIVVPKRGAAKRAEEEYVPLEDLGVEKNSF